MTKRSFLLPPDVTPRMDGDALTEYEVEMRLSVLSPILFSLILLPGLPAAGQSTQPSTAATNASASEDEQQIISAARARANACASGDAQRWATFVDADFRDIEGNHTWTREQILDECQQAARVIPGHKIERLVSDFRFRFVGKTALVGRFRLTRELGGERDCSPTVVQ
jgi:hypothetical protein